MDSTRKIIEYWYNKLSFNSKYDDDFYCALKEIEIPAESSVDNFVYDENNGAKNFLSFLYFCENLKNEYAKKGIDEAILYDTLSDIPIWLDTWSSIKGTMFLGETDWLKRHLGMKLIKLGRLQFCMAGAEHAIPDMNIKENDNVMEIHIPAVGALKTEECLSSIEKAKSFFKEYFPEYEYKCFTCHSWLLDTSLNEILSQESNIIKFQKLFDIKRQDKSDAILKYVFKWNVSREDIDTLECTSSFSKKIKDRIQSGGHFYESLGTIDK